MCISNLAAKVTEKIFDNKKVGELNKGILLAYCSSEAGLKLDSLDYDSLHIRAYYDAYYATNDDFSSQLE